jgi:uncharacterized protein YjlB
MNLDLQSWKAPAGDGPIPNHPRFPVLIYHGVAVGEIKRVFADHGWGGAWTDGVFDFHHFHSTSHEVLAVVSGSATLELGGPQGEAFEVENYDLLREADDAARERIRTVPVPDQDPVGGQGIARWS